MKSNRTDNVKGRFIVVVVFVNILNILSNESEEYMDKWERVLGLNESK